MERTPDESVTLANVAIVRDTIEVARLEEQVAEVGNGAICAFIGQTRNRSRGRDVTHLFYEAYEPMALKQLREIAAEAERRWPCTVAIHHRLGKVGLGEASVVVVVGSPHRAEAFDACRYCIDTLKAQVPIWKKEVCPDGTFWIEGETSVEKRDGDSAPIPVSKSSKVTGSENI